MIGGTYKITSEVTAYAGYSEANRAPTPLELGCADPVHPCIIAAFLVSDPPLKQVVSRTVEAGLRGTKELNIGTLGWKTRRIPRHQYRRHPGHSESGDRRDSAISRTSARRVARASRPQVTSDIEDAAALRQLRPRRCALPRCLDARLPTARSPMSDGNIQVLPGNRIPGDPAQPDQGSASTMSITDAFKVGGDAAVRQQPVFCRR